MNRSISRHRHCSHHFHRPERARLGYATTEAPRAPPAPRPPKAQTRKRSAHLPFHRGPLARAGSTPSTAGAASRASEEHRVGWCSRICRRGRRALPRASRARQGAAPVPRARASASHRPSPPCERRSYIRETADASGRTVRHHPALQLRVDFISCLLCASFRTFVCNDSSLLKMATTS